MKIQTGYLCEIRFGHGRLLQDYGYGNNRKKMIGGNMDLINKNFLHDVSELLNSARKQAKTAVDLSRRHSNGKRII